MSDQFPNQLPTQLPRQLPDISGDELLEKAVIMSRPKSTQTPPWMMIGVVVVMLAIPLGLFLMTRDASDSPKTDPKIAVAEPTRTLLKEPTTKPVATSTPFPSPTRVPSPTFGPTPTAAISPTPKATGLSNLNVEEIFFEDPQNGSKIDSTAYAGQHISLRARLKNTGTADAKNFVSYWKIQGSLAGKNERGSLKAAAEAVYDDVNSLVYSGVVLKEGDFAVGYFADPDNVLGESNSADNSKTKNTTVLGTRSDLEAADIEFYSQETGEKIALPLAGQKVVVKPVIKNLGQDKQVDYEVKWYIGGTEVKKSVSKTWVGVGESKVTADGYQMTLAAGTTEFKIEVNSDKAIPETNSGNNVRIVSKTF